MPAIRRQVHIAATPRAVWRALTTADGLASWWVDEARFDARKGGRVVFKTTGDDGEDAEDRGMIHTWRPTSHLEVAFDRSSSTELRGSRVAFQVARDGDETLLTLVHSGGEILDDDEGRARLDKEWRQAFLALQDMLDAS